MAEREGLIRRVNQFNRREIAIWQGFTKQHERIGKLLKEMVKEALETDCLPQMRIVTSGFLNDENPSVVVRRGLDLGPIKGEGRGLLVCDNTGAFDLIATERIGGKEQEEGGKVYQYSEAQMVDIDNVIFPPFTGTEYRLKAIRMLRELMTESIEES